MKSIIKSGIILFVIDFIYLSLIAAKPFTKMVSIIQKEPVKVKYVYAAISYILLIISFNYFVLHKKFTYIDTFILGMCVYGVFDFTNLALFNKYNLMIGLQDTIWGGILFTTTLYIYNHIP